MPLLAKVMLEMHSADVCPGDSANGMCLRYWLETPGGEVLGFDKRLELDAMVASKGWGLSAGEVKIPIIKPIGILEPISIYCHDKACKGELQPNGFTNTLVLRSPDGFNRIVTRTEAVALCAEYGWELRDANS